MCEPDKEEYFYRFIVIGNELLSSLHKRCKPHIVDESWHEKMQGYVASVSLLDASAVQSVQDFLSNHDLSSVSHGVYISLVTDSDQAGFTVPDYILQLLSEHKGTLDVSFIMV